ncbi:MAG: hypothetical protein B6U97_02885 [Candidatus Altiarchaeales archaeon ex4484_96]|nr:MAG: hypothetical protein B6U97_02885 [Candidatus Altiarchaeales archaeon ex4484_96]
MIDNKNKKKIKCIADLAVEASLLEVNTQKPGNITPNHDFTDTTYKDFILGCSALRPAIESAALRGYRAAEGEIRYSRIGLGELMKKAVSDVKASHTGGNTHLGTIMLYIPLAASCGMCLSQQVNLRDNLRINLKKCIKLSSVEDSIQLYEAILYSNMSGLGKRGELDVKSRDSISELRDKNISFHQLMRYSAETDYIARELASSLDIVFNTAIPLLQRIHAQLEDTNAAIIQMYLILLSRYPDSLISRKKGLGYAEQVSAKAKDVLDLGGVLTPDGREAIDEFDVYLRSEGNKLNPGTTADLVAASIYVLLLYTEDKLKPEII